MREEAVTLKRKRDAKTVIELGCVYHLPHFRFTVKVSRGLLWALVTALLQHFPASLHSQLTTPEPRAELFIALILQLTLSSSHSRPCTALTSPLGQVVRSGGIPA